MIDHFDTWRSDLEKRITAGQDISVDLKNGAVLVERAASRTGTAKDGQQLPAWAKELRAGGDAAEAPAMDDELAALMEELPDETLMSRYERELMVMAE